MAKSQASTQHEGATSAFGFPLVEKFFWLVILLIFAAPALLFLTWVGSSFASYFFMPDIDAIVEQAQTERAQLLVDLPEPSEIQDVPPQEQRECDFRCDSRDEVFGRDGFQSASYSSIEFDLDVIEQTLRTQLDDAGYSLQCEVRGTEYFEASSNFYPVRLSVDDELVRVAVLTSTQGPLPVGSTEYAQVSAERVRLCG